MDLQSGALAGGIVAANLWLLRWLISRSMRALDEGIKSLRADLADVRIEVIDLRETVAFLRGYINKRGEALNNTHP